MATLDEIRSSKGLFIQCPSCESSFSAKRARLFDATGPLPSHAAEHLAGERAQLGLERQALRVERANLQRRSFTATASGGVGQILEMLTPSLPGLPSTAQDCRVLLKPVDYIAFEGAARGEVKAIRFIEVKTGAQRLSGIQRAIKAAIDAGEVSLRVADHHLPVSGSADI
jgi:predicted Holliday junction resolvase-like endonuclease